MSQSYFSLLATLATFFFTFASGQNGATSTSQSNVPTGTPVPGNYSGPLRPQVHFSPPQGFMNDPNGMFVDADGIYHLYYQCKKALVLFHKHRTKPSLQTTQQQRWQETNTGVTQRRRISSPGSISPSPSFPVRLTKAFSLAQL